MIEGTEAINELVTLLNTTGTPVQYGYLDMVVSSSLKPPFIAVAPIEDDEQTSSIKAKVDRSVLVVGVIPRTQGDAIKPMTDIDELLKTVRSTLTFDFDSPPMPLVYTMGYTIGKTRFKLPEAGDEFIYFELDLTIQFVENRT
jgi:hypothetical protein